MAKVKEPPAQPADKNRFQLDNDPLWYKDAIIYELHVKAYHDSSADGVGDFRGLAQKLDYLQDLGVTAIWLLPFSSSPLRDDGYDTSDYTDVHPLYGTLADFKLFLREAHRRGLRVITELVLNHTSDQHPWFQRARRAPAGSHYRNFYVWSDTPDRYRDARIIFKDFEASNWSWDPVAKAYYWHRFYSHQPDLNWENPEVKETMFSTVDYWFSLGVDGLRLDAVPYLFESEGSNCENLPQTHRALKDLRARVDQRWPNRMLLAEANQWPEDAVAYFGNGDECHMAFHFPVMPRLFMAQHMENRFPIVDIMEQTPALPSNCQWALFLRNHDELTLEMVTDEERDYMYRSYAQDPQMRINLGIRRRLAPLLGNDRKKIELMKGLLFSLPGTPVLYYGDEIGMGDNVYLGDRDGVRTPMQWSPDRNAGFSGANPQRLFLPTTSTPEFHYETVNVETQQQNSNSLLWWTKHLIALRKSFKAFGRGTLEFLFPENRKVLAFIRQFEDEVILVVANLSRLAQPVELDLSRFRGRMPVELWGRTDFPCIEDHSYILTLAPHGFYWFSLERPRVREGDIDITAPHLQVPVLRLAGEWETVFNRENRSALERILPAYLRSRRWFGGKARHIKSLHITEAVPIGAEDPAAFFTMLQVDYTEGDPDLYMLSLAFASGDSAARIRESLTSVIVAQLSGRNLQGKNGVSEGLLYDAFYNPAVRQSLLQAIARRRTFRGTKGEVVCAPKRELRQFWNPSTPVPDAAIMRAEQSNTSIVYGDKVILKLFRKLEAGQNPDLEIGAFLMERTKFAHANKVAGYLEYQRGYGESPITMGVAFGFVPNEGDAWQYTLDSLGSYLERALARPAKPRDVAPPAVPLLDLLATPLPPLMQDLVSTYVDSARLLGRRTAEMHLALSSVPDDPNFAPEPFSALYQRSIYQTMRNLAGESLLLLRRSQRQIPEPMRELAQRVLASEQDIHRRFRAILERKIETMRCRIHGDYHLGQVLYTGRDFVIVDFEGEPSHALSSRRIKRSPLRDVAGMMRSFQYAAAAAIRGESGRGVSVRPEDVPELEQWARNWQVWMSLVYVREYLEASAESPLIPRRREDLALLLQAFLLEKAVYELGYELNSRPTWVDIPLRGILQLLETGI